MSIKHICFVSEGYPTSTEPIFTFVASLVEAIADRGIRCTVISPQSVTKSLKSYFTLRKKVWSYQTQNGAIITVYQPYYLSFSNYKVAGKSISYLMMKHAINRCLHKKIIKEKPDVIYGHFWSAAYAGYPFAKANNIPLFVATGESVIELSNVEKGFVDYVSGVICVSSKNLFESIKLGLTIKEKCGIFPNGFDSTKFYKLDKQLCRKELGYPSNAFICISVGSFINRKGINRVDQSLIELNDDDIYSVFIGSGNYLPTYKQILFAGRLPHYKLITYLNAADVFVLPTLHEGCCNAIVEALACGIPVISSDRDFNRDILNNENSILIDPNSIDSIKSAIVELKNNTQKYQKMSIGAFESSKELTIEERAKSIINFMSVLYRATN